jgi:hypothetical protein
MRAALIPRRVRGRRIRGSGAGRVQGLPLRPGQSLGYAVCAFARLSPIFGTSKTFALARSRDVVRPFGR